MSFCCRFLLPWGHFFPCGFPVLFLVFHPSFPNSAPLCSPSPTFTLSSEHRLEPHSPDPPLPSGPKFHHIPQIPCPRKALPAPGWHTQLCSPGEGAKGSQGQEAECHPHGTGLQGTGFPRRWHCSKINLGVLGELGTGSTCGEGRRWDGTGNAVTSSWPHWVLNLHLRGKME